MDEDVGSNSSYLVCWGSGEFGQHSHSHSDDVDLLQGTVPVFNTPHREDQVKLVACGASHTVAVTNSNKLYVWGNGNSGQLGCGGPETIWEPQVVDLGSTVPRPSYSIEGISCGGRHTVLLMKDGTVVGFGNNNYGQLGLRESDTETDKQWTPCLLDVFPLPVKQIACGDKHTIFLLVDGQVMSLGSNHYGQAGRGDKEAATLPRLVKLEEPIKTITAGANHSLALSESGLLYTWGYSKACYGTVSEDILTPEIVRVTAPVHQVAAGSTHSVIVTTLGDVYTWGYGPDGQLGHGEDVLSLPIPTEIPQGHIDGCVRAVTCGESLTSAVTDNGDLYLWGRNSHTIDSALPSSHPVFSPTCVSRGKDLCVKYMTCGAWHAAAIVSTDMMKITDDEIKSLTPLVCDKATSTSPMLKQDNSENHFEESIEYHVKIEDAVINKDPTVHNKSSTTIEESNVNWTPSQRVLLPKLETVHCFPKSIEMDLDGTSKLYKKLPNMQISESDGPVSDLQPGTGSDFPTKSNFKYPKYRPQMFRSRTVFPDPLPQTVGVSKSTAAKFILPREETSICSKMVGFVPLEDLNDYNNNTLPEADGWLHRQNSSIKSGYTNSSHFPRRKLRFSSGKKLLGLSRYNTCIDLKNSSPHRTVSSLGSAFSQKPPVVRSSGNHEPINSYSTLGSSKPFQDRKVSEKDQSKSYTSTIQNSEMALPSVYEKNLRRNTYIYRREKTIQIPKLKPIERRIHKLDNMKSSYWNSKLRAGLHEERFSPLRTNLVETISNDGVSKLNEALMSRQQSFILHSNDSRN